MICQQIYDEQLSSLMLHKIPTLLNYSLETICCRYLGKLWLLIIMLL